MVVSFSVGISFFSSQARERMKDKQKQQSSFEKKEKKKTGEKSVQGTRWRKARERDQKRLRGKKNRWRKKPSLTCRKRYRASSSLTTSPPGSAVDHFSPTYDVRLPPAPYSITTPTCVGVSTHSKTSMSRAHEGPSSAWTPTSLRIEGTWSLRKGREKSLMATRRRVARCWKSQVSAKAPRPRRRMARWVGEDADEAEAEPDRANEER